MAWHAVGIQMKVNLKLSWKNIDGKMHSITYKFSVTYQSVRCEINFPVAIVSPLIKLRHQTDIERFIKNR